MEKMFIAVAALLAINVLAQAENPNVLFLVSDDLRPELGCYGNTVIKSPNIDRLAKRGIVFKRAYCQQAVCSPSRSSVMTGMRPDTTKVWDLNTHFRKALPDVATLPQLFKNHGYVAQGLGKIYHGDLVDPASWSSEEKKPKSGKKKKAAVLPPAGYTPPAGVKLTSTDRGQAFGVTDEDPNAGGEGELADEAIAALRDFKSSKKPFFLAVGFRKPHLPFVAPKAYWDMYDPAEIPMASNRYLPKDAPAYALVDKNEMWKYSGVPDDNHLPGDYARGLKHGYYAAVSYMDAQLGRVIEELDALDLSKNTIIILWGDHGWKLGEHDHWCKHSNVEDDARAPLLIVAPGRKITGSSSALVEFVDIYPTITELAGLPLAGDLEGTSLVPLLHKPDLEWKTAAFTQYPRTINKQKKLMGYSMRTDRYRFTRWVHKDDQSKVDAVELYDHERDPMENVNIAANPANKELVEKLTGEWKKGWKGAINK
jgi:iduronate 2-sulfatase